MRFLKRKGKERGQVLNREFLQFTAHMTHARFLGRA